MSALGQKQTSAHVRVMSALPSKATSTSTVDFLVFSNPPQEHGSLWLFAPQSRPAIPHRPADQAIAGKSACPLRFRHAANHMCDPEMLSGLISFNATQQFLFQRSPEVCEPHNLGRSSELRESLNLRLETIEELDDFAIFSTQRVKARVSRHQLANGCFIFGKLC